MPPLTQRQAVKAYRAVCTALGVEPQVSAATGRVMVVRQGEGRWPSRPVLCHQFQGWYSTSPWAVVWEEGPFEWAMFVPHGGEGIAPAELADDVFAEPINGWALGLYRA